MIEITDIALPHGVTLACRTCGPRDAPVLLFVHGFPEAAFVWDALLERFGARWRCVAPNLRGYERSSRPAQIAAYRPKHLVADLAALIDALGAPAEAVVAHDWGGAVAWNLAALRPTLLKRLAIVNAPHPATFLRELKSNAEQQRASAYMNFFVRPDAAALLAEHDYRRLWQAFGAAPWLDDAMRARYRAVWDAGLDGPLNYYRASPLRPPTSADDPLLKLELPDDAVTVRLPTLVVWGERDTALLPSLLDGLERWVPNLTCIREPAASHWIVHEQPQRVGDALERFLQTTTY
jgi:pimeloyl-ACP methyl ester carboxylesterase